MFERDTFYYARLCTFRALLYVHGYTDTQWNCKYSILFDNKYPRFWENCEKLWFIFFNTFPLSLFIERKLKSSFRKIVRLFIVVYRKFHPMLFFQRLLPVKNSFLLKKERIVYYKKGSCFLIRDRGYFIFQFSNQPKTLNPPSTFSFTFWSFLYRNPLFPLD